MRNSKMNDWGKLIARAKKNDQKAIEEIYELTYRQGFSVAMQMLKNEEDVLDVLQDSYISVFKNINSLKDANKFKSWFNCIVANRCRDYLRKNKAINFSDIEIDEDIDFEDTLENNIIEFSPEEAIDYDETKRIVNEILQSLPVEQKLCILMYYYNELSIKEISEALSCSENTIKTRLSRGRNQIKDKVKELEKTGIKLYNFSPITLLVWLLHNEEEKILIMPYEVIQKNIAEVIKHVKSKGVVGNLAKRIFETSAKKVILSVLGVATVATLACTPIINEKSEDETEKFNPEITQKIYLMEVELGGELFVEAKDFLVMDDFVAGEITINDENVNTLEVGEYDVVATYTIGTIEWE